MACTLVASFMGVYFKRCFKNCCVQYTEHDISLHLKSGELPENIFRSLGITGVSFWVYFYAFLGFYHRDECVLGWGFNPDPLKYTHAYNCIYCDTSYCAS